MSMTPRSRRNSLPSLWEQAVELWNELVLGYGRSIDLMRWGRMRALYHRALGHCLRDLEKLVRRAIRADAETSELPPLKPILKRPRPRLAPPPSPQDRLLLRAPDPTDPATWKVAFRMSPRVYDPTRKRYKRRSRPVYDPEAQRPCRGYAFRIEALRRAINHREAYVTRYARRLARIRQARIEEAGCEPRDEFLAVLCSLHGPPEEDGSGLMTFNVEAPNAKLIEPG
jgi:hypothetical protein